MAQCGGGRLQGVSAGSLRRMRKAISKKRLSWVGLVGLSLAELFGGVDEGGEGWRDRLVLG